MSGAQGNKVQEVDHVETSAKDLILALLACNQVPNDIIAAVQKQFGRKYDRRTISYYKVNYKTEIAEIRSRYIDNLHNLVPIANIINRAIIRQKLIDDLQKPTHLWRTVPVWYKGDRVGERLEGSHKVINEILDSQAAEMKDLVDEKQKREMFELLKESGLSAINLLLSLHKNEGE